MSHKQFEVIVELKPEVLDPQGRAICETLGRVGVKGVNSVKVSKRFVIEVEESVANDQKRLDEIASEYLSNPVAEVYQIKPIS